MNEFYQARDSRLERDVAVKVLPEHFASQRDMQKRFEREARSSSKLHHPHICALFDLGSESGTSYLVMEYLQGEPLDRRLSRGPMPRAEAQQTGLQIVSVLDEAHQKGLIHRDLKPGNVMLTSAGAKLLDFGLAKPGAASTNRELDVTVTNSLTVAGSIVGRWLPWCPNVWKDRIECAGGHLGGGGSRHTAAAYRGPVSGGARTGPGWQYPRD